VESPHPESPDPESPDPESPHQGHDQGPDQDRHALQRGGRLVRRVLVCRGAHRAVAAHGTGKETDIDVGLKVFLIAAEGEPTENPGHDRKAAKQLQTAQTCVSRRKQGSHRRAKAAHQCAKQQQHVRRQRCDFHHTTALALMRHYDAIYVEAIQPANLSRRPAPKPDEHGTSAPNGASQKAGLNTSSHDAGWGHVLASRADTAACAGTRVDAVNPAHTSQECSTVLAEGTLCGERLSKALSVRTRLCPRCGYVADRDANAARNLLWRGQRLRGVPALAGAMNREPAGL
jgi:putative transposase